MRLSPWIFLSLAGCLLAAPFASANDKENSFVLYPVAGLEEVTEKTHFSLDETPYLYFRFPKGAHVATQPVVESPNDTRYFPQNLPAPDKAERWLSLRDNLDERSNASPWSSVKEPGTWLVNAGYYTADHQLTEGQTSFAVSAPRVANQDLAVTPEPANALLFLAGGGLLIGAALRSRQRRTARIQ